MDILQYMDDIKVVQCMNGLAWKMPNKIIPFGNYNDFLYSYQITPVRKMQHSYTIISKYSARPENLKIYTYLCSDISRSFGNIRGRQELGNCFQWTPAPLPLNRKRISVTTTDTKLTRSKKTIDYRDNSYYVELPWHKDRIHYVSSN